MNATSLDPKYKNHPKLLICNIISKLFCQNIFNTETILWQVNNHYLGGQSQMQAL